MKKKFLIGALGLASVFTMSSFEGEQTQEQGRRFFGSEITGVASCVPNGHYIDGSPRFLKTYTVQYYVFWIGVSESTSAAIDAPDCDMPS